MLSKQIIVLVVFSFIALTANSQFTRPMPTYPSNPTYPRSDSSSLTGNWIMNSVGGYNTNISVSISSNTINFRYCNTQSYSYTTSSNNRISIKSGASTLMMCRMAAPPTEDQVRNALVSASSYSISRNTLTLRNSRNQVIATLTKGSNSTNPTNPLQPSQSIVGNWTATTAKGHSVSFAVTITANTVSYRYCNNKNMNYTTNGNSINFGLGISTLMACFNQNPDESTVSSAFSDAKTYSISNGVLTFFDANGNVVLRLTSGPAPITGTYNLTSINNVATIQLNKVVVTISATTISFRYCNGKNFQYTITGNNINVQSGISTLMFCSDLSPTEGQVSAAFTEAKTFQMSGNTLTLFGSDGRMRATLSKN